MEFLYDYGLFLAKAVTLVLAIVIIIGSIASAASKQKKGKGHLEIDSISDKLDEIRHHSEELVLDKDTLKKIQKERKKALKEEKGKDPKPHLYVIDFKGSMDAHEVEGLREEVTALLTIAKKEDEVLIRLESGGGVVHGYGLAASQLQRIKDANIPLTVAVDKVAASGGYMMACVADKLIAAKFAIIGSIGVIAQLPNFNKLLKEHHIDFEQHTAGEFKRTLTVFGENDDKGREKFQQELEEIHVMFKGFVQDHRPSLSIDDVATGEYWYGIKAKELALVDALQTSDDYMLKANEAKNIFQIRFVAKKNLAEKFSQAASIGLLKTLSGLWQKSQWWGR